MNSRSFGNGVNGSAPNIVQISANATVVNILIYIIIFFLMGFIVMTSYNYSLPMMNENYKPIDYQTALCFTILLSAVAFYVKSNAGYVIRQYIM